MEERHIVSIDLGTAKLAITVAKIDGNDVQIIYYKEVPSEGIRYSGILNVKQVSDRLKELIREAEDALKMKITQAVVGMPRYAIRQETRQAKMEREGDTCIEKDEIDYLKKFALDSYPLEDAEIDVVYGAVAQSFSNGEVFQAIEEDIIGMTGKYIEGDFKIFIGKKSSLRNIDLVMNNLNISAAAKYFTADSTAKAVLTKAEMNNGVALIDFGAGCTSVTIYHGNVLRYYASIPFGGRDITNDIKTECTISKKLAENIKLGFGACMPEKLQSLSEKIILIKSNSTDPNKQLPVKYLSEIITARVEEIIMAILYAIQRSGYADKLRSGIVVTGGSAQIANLNNFIIDTGGYNVRTGYARHLFSSSGCNGLGETSATTSIGMILKAKDDDILNCVMNVDEYSAYKKAEVETASKEEIEREEEELVEEGKHHGTLFDKEEMDEIIQEPKKKKTKPKKQKKENSPISWIKDIANDLFESISEDESNK